MNPQYIGIQDSENTFIGMRFRTHDEAELVIRHVKRLIEQEAEDRAYVAQGIPPPGSPRPFLYCLNCMMRKIDPSAPRGAQVKALAICSPHHFVHEFERLLLYHLDRYFEAPSQDILRDLYFAINAVDFGMAQPEYCRLVYRHSRAVTQKTRTVPVKIGNGAIFNIHVPLGTYPNEVVDFHVSDLLARFGPQLMTIFNAVVLEKRVVFQGYNCTMEELCKLVLAAASLVSPPLRDVLHRVFPCTNLVYLDYERLPSYIVGVSNPVFESRTDHWDLFCNIQTGKVTINPRSGGDIARVCAASAEVDTALYDELERYSRSRLGEDAIRFRIQKYMQHIADIASGVCTPPDAAKHAERISEWRKTTSYAAYKVYFDERFKPSLFLNPGEVVSRVAELKYNPAMPAADAQQTFELIARNTTQPNQIDELISLLPDEDGGLFPICAGLFHPSKAVRVAAAQICSRMGTSNFGAAIFNSFGMLADFALRNALAEADQDEDSWETRISVART